MYQDAKLTQKLVAFLYTNDNWAEKEIRETSPFTIATHNLFGVILTKQVKDLYDKNFKSLRMKLKKISENGKLSHALG